jgi:peptidylprolyl isomerase
MLARLLLPVLVTGLLTACSGEQDEGLPTVKGAYGDKPVVQIAKGTKPGRKLQTKVLRRGKGPKVRRGDLLVADYLGKNYRSGKVFDNSYDRGVPAAFTLKSGSGGVISGWVKALSGVPIGSRVLLVAPPKEGYGKSGNPQAGIKSRDSLVFVVDLLGAYSTSQALPQSTPEQDLPAQLPVVEGEQDPTITVPDGAPPPREPRATVIATGTGPQVARGRLVVVHYTAVGWDNTPLSSSWQDGPQGVPVGGQQPSPFDLLIGVPVGSRVVLELPAQTEGDPAKDSVAVVIDVIGQHPGKAAGQ